MCKYVNIKKDNKDEINNPFTDIDINFIFFCFLEDINWKKEKNKDNQSVKFPKDAVIRS